MRFVSIGDLVLDYYYQDNKLLGVCGGNTSHNIIANLAYNNIPTAVYSVCGNDIQGEIAIKSLEDLNVDTSNIERIDNIRTRSLHVSEFKTKRRCPICGEKTWYQESLINTNDILNSISKDDILVFDSLNTRNQIIIDNTKNLKIIDLGYYQEFKELSNEEIINKIKNKFIIINFNERVTKYLLERFKLNSDLGLYKLFNPKFMTITRGTKGSTFIYENKIYNFDLVSLGNEIDPSGAGDTFISSIIKDWIDNNYIFDSTLFKNWYKKSNDLTSIVVSKIGARSHIYPLYKVETTNNCSCNEINLIKNKQLTR